MRPRPRQPIAVLKVVLTLLLVVCFSGAPRALAVVIGGGEPPCGACCAGDGGRGGEDGDGTGDAADDDVCSPMCAMGPCAKILPSIPSVTAQVETGFVEQLAPVAVDDAPVEPVADGHVVAVFHPPRA